MTTLRQLPQKLSFHQSNEMKEDLQRRRVRDLKILRTVLSGSTIGDCAQHYKVTEDRVRQVVLKMTNLLYFRSADRTGLEKPPTGMKITTLQSNGAFWLQKLDQNYDAMLKLTADE